MGDFLAGILDDRMIVRRVERVGIADVDLFLPGLGLTLGVLDRDPRPEKPVADRPHHVLFLGGAHDRIVDVVAGKGLKIVVAFVEELVEALFEQEELKLGRHHRLEPQRAGAGDLALENGAGRMGDLFVGVVVKDVAHHHRRSRQPGHTAQRGQVGLVDIVAIARLPVGRAVALDRRHLEVGGQQVVAAMGFLVAAVHEMCGVKALAHQASLHVDDAGQHGVDFSGCHGGLESVESQVGGHGSFLSI